MKKYIKMTGLLGLLCFSFFITERTSLVVKQQDPITVAIEKNKTACEVNPKEARIENDTFIPGISGSKVNIDKSYAKMKRFGAYNLNMFIFDEVKPKEQLDKNYDKYIISGNKSKKMVNFTFEVHPNDEIDTILKLLRDKNIRADFFIDGLWLENNSGAAHKLINAGHHLNIYGYDGDYKSDYFLWSLNILKTLMNKQNIYCLTLEKNETTLDICQRNKLHTILPSIVTSSYPLKDVKEKLENGSIISYRLTAIVYNELGSVINHINSKGYKITTLNHLLRENESSN